MIQFLFIKSNEHKIITIIYNYCRSEIFLILHITLNFFNVYESETIALQFNIILYRFFYYSTFPKIDNRIQTTITGCLKVVPLCSISNYFASIANQWKRLSPRKPEALVPKITIIPFRWEILRSIENFHLLRKLPLLLDNVAQIGNLIAH